MKYTGATTQLSLVFATILLTTGIRRLLYNYLLRIPPITDDVAYDHLLSTSLIAFSAGLVSIFLVNLAGIRAIFVFYVLTNILSAVSAVTTYTLGKSAFHKIAMYITTIGYDLDRAATLVVVLAYPGERWKARALAIFLLIEYFAITLGDIIALVDPGSTQSRFRGSIAFLCLSCLALVPALAIAPSENVVRSDGVYLVSPKTTILTELRQTAKMFTNKYMLLLLPYMFSYPLLFGSAEVNFPNVTAIILYDGGKMFIVFMSQMLDVQWAGRRTRGYVGMVTLVVFFVVSISITAALRIIDYDLTGLDVSWPRPQIEAFVMGAVMNQRYAMLMTSYFFAGAASSFIELFGYWVMGTLTNDFKSTARFVGTYHSAMALGGLLGYQLTNNTEHAAYTTNIPMYVAIALTIVSFVCLYFILRRISETNDWTLERISNRGSDTQPTSQASMETITVISDVKYEHHKETTA
ncbi:hypothetical protein LPJ57_001608 [Coemansia sp. RSA 486]|nr:hypothetical protein LPJ57_001608 [Coemansia sp. RSA 486]KAJ2237704.1 hypothetical protein IWW45_000710 [Coemansia sp. RSA 485]KAJ2638204.1 hypothetical protein GGF40_001817 [Coemansia sp. RSA 1286]